MAQEYCALVGIEEMSESEPPMKYRKGSAVVETEEAPVGVCVLNIGLFVYMALDDERVLLGSPIGADYQTYKERVGMFLPLLKRQ